MSDYTAEKIRYYRKTKGWTQRELAEKCIDISFSSIRRYETIGEGNRDPKSADLCEIARVLEVDPSFLLEPPPYPSEIEVMDDKGNRVYMDPHRDVWPKNGDPIDKWEFEREKEEGRMTDDDLRKWRNANPRLRVDNVWPTFNEAGRQKAADLVELVAKVPEYKRDPSAKKTIVSHKEDLGSVVFDIHVEDPPETEPDDQ